MADAMTEGEFKAHNERRLQLINKKYDGFTDEERARSFFVAGWFEEFDRRSQANLTDAEHRELEVLQRMVDAYWIGFAKALGGGVSDIMGTQLDEIERRLANGKETKQ